MQASSASSSSLLKWLALIASSLLFALILEHLNIPAPFMIGAMLGGVLATATGYRLTVAPPLVNFSQAVIGCLIGASIRLESVDQMLLHTSLYIGITVLVLSISVFIGLVVTRMQVLPGTTGIWGSLPGAAPMMIILSEQNGADSRLVAFIQYTRVVMVALIASLTISLFDNHPTSASPPLEWNPFSGDHGVAALLVILASLFLARFIKLPASVFLTALVVTAAIQLSGLHEVPLPTWLLSLGFLLLGWSIGLRFTVEVRAAAARAFSRVVLLLLAMIVLCGIPACLLVLFFDIDPLTAYLATSPGGVDSIAIIATGSNVDMSFIMTAQTFRFVLLLIFGPILSRFVARKMQRSSACAPP